MLYNIPAVLPDSDQVRGGEVLRLGEIPGVHLDPEYLLQQLQHTHTRAWCKTIVTPYIK